MSVSVSIFTCLSRFLSPFREHTQGVEEVVHLDLNSQQQTQAQLEQQGQDKPEQHIGEKQEEHPKDKDLQPLPPQSEHNRPTSSNVKEEEEEEGRVTPTEGFVVQTGPASSADGENEARGSGSGEENKEASSFTREVDDCRITRTNDPAITPKKENRDDSPAINDNGLSSGQNMRKVGDKQEESSAKQVKENDSSNQASPFASAAEGVEERSHQVGDNCPVCLANAAEATFLTSVHGQGEGLVIDLVSQQQQDQQQQPLHQQQQQQVPLPSMGHASTSRTDGGFTSENLVPPVGNYGDARLKESVRPEGRQGLRAASAVPGRARFSFPNQQARVAAHNTRRPQSAVDPTRYYVIDHPPRVMATGQAASMFSHNGGGHFKTDFQHQREEAWRRTTRHGRQRPLTAIVQRSSSQFPLVQQQLSGSHSTKLINPGIRITRTDGWLAGGRDLYWEGIRKRPKSGHTPGWLEGLPDSMKKQRPRSAFTASLHQQPRSRLSQRPQSGSALIVSSCYKCDNRAISQQGSGRPARGADVRYMLTFSQQQLPLQQQENPKTPLQISLQHQHHQEDPLLLLDPEIGLGDENPPPLCSPVSDAGRQDWSFQNMDY
ncbi:DnaJ-like protein subfamily C member 14 [Elysia marginata]|uniref:DnaJ-like protein subfamily C member 14 n=1 Tax=Elysia marginata TaxID=1093978 RepID=A0AAV4EG74_9GAST|nr:DnaJ-like protein subfamily C member 14 [Elysia marginata]